MKTLEEAILDKILYIGNQIPSGVAEDQRKKFVLLGTPQELINDVTEEIPNIKDESSTISLEEYQHDL